MTMRHAHAAPYTTGTRTGAHTDERARIINVVDGTNWANLVRKPWLYSIRARLARASLSEQIHHIITPFLYAGCFRDRNEFMKNKTKALVHARSHLNASEKLKIRNSKSALH
ncbi:hypothetical protein EVAR_19393_1 [Eumeta japonica]|uniref:Uncharacterized protein n=1 Tax=Eumeta variegata TaxID=151549 RepID=A0A4C1TRJ5_EUMVA|nr:hypothetical protein EVAR_19393_1 [Eumeta japonica]